MSKSFLEQAGRNFAALKNNTYPGRGIIVGFSQDERYFVQVYWIMGRSRNSRNRIFVCDGVGNLHTRPDNEAEVEDASLIIYRAMAEQFGVYAVSNGKQTDALVDYLWIHDNTFLNVSPDWCHEPDSPNFTPRISAILFKQNDQPVTEISMLRKSPFSFGCDRFFYRYDSFCPGAGYCITTYLCDGNPLPPFVGEPYPILLPGCDATSIAHSIWGQLNEDNRISLAVKLIDAKEWGQSKVEIINKYKGGLVSPV